MAAVSKSHVKCWVKPNVLAYPQSWQTPARTEMAAFESALRISNFNNNLYVGFPWATLIDGLSAGFRDLDLLLIMLSQIKQQLSRTQGRVFSVSQHVDTLQHLEFFNSLGVTDLFWPHKTKDLEFVDGIRLRPFPLYPAQISTFPSNIPAPKRFLANFFGAYTPKDYLSDVRGHIFALRGTTDKLRIVQRGDWHFQRAVYEEQMLGIEPDDSIIDHENTYKRQYLNAILASEFTLCPTGIGPNTTRIFETLALGVIPIVLTTSLHLPGDEYLWEQACVIRDDSKSGLDSALQHIKTLSETEIEDMRRAGIALYEQVGPKNYAELIQNGLCETSSHVA